MIKREHMQGMSMACADIIAAPDSYELIIASDEAVRNEIEPDCVVRLSERYSIWYYEAGRLPEFSFRQSGYSAIPKCYGLLSPEAMEASGVTRLQNLPNLSLTGEGILIAVIDTGVAYDNRAFRNVDGSTRIVAMWDQDGAAPEEESVFPEATVTVPYGRVYGRGELDAILEEAYPPGAYPGQDIDGHGSLLAGIAAGSKDARSDFTGAAPDAELVVVKLRKAKQHLKDYYFIPDRTDAYAESDIMTGIDFAQRTAERLGKPLVILIGLGTNNGSHSGSGPLSEYLDSIGIMRHRAVVAAAGNEANMRHHFFGRAESMLTPTKVEINVEDDMPGLYVEFWGLAPERFSLSVQSPTGEILPREGMYLGSRELKFLFEGTTIQAYYQDAGQARRDQLIFLRFKDMVKGIWTINVYPEDAVTGNFHMWLPMQGMVDGAAYFLRPTPDVTITSPGDASIPMTSGGYQVSTSGLEPNSGRGFDSDGGIKPDFLAPGVDVVGAGLRDNYVSGSGTSTAAAITAGACAQILEWAVTRGNAIGINSVDIKNVLIRGAVRMEGATYPSPAYGYGLLQVYDAVANIRQNVV